MLNNHRTVVVLIMVSLLGILAWGCASSSFVKKRTKEVEDMAKANKAQLEQLDAKLSATDAKADDALSEARRALRKAEEAAGYVNYQVIGERDVNFDFNRYDLTKIAQDILDEIGATMQQRPALILEIEGHTDNIGSDAYNQVLGEKRAENVKRFLADKYGVAIHRIFYISHGESKPKVLNDTRTGRATNRRAVLRLLGPPSE
jgi:outer membrane protein OmpA-like peptidoglycan-associated protein